MTTIANDGEVPIHSYYGPVPDDPALRAWLERRLPDGPPFGPRAMVYVGQGSPEMTAGRLRMLQELGADSLLLACDLPSQLGFDADHRLSRAQVGRAGVSISTLDDMRAVCEPVHFDRLDSLGMLANSVGHVGLAMVSEVLRERGGGDVRLVMQNDPLKEFTARGTEIFSPTQAVRIAGDAVAYAIDEDIPGYAMTVCSNHYDVAGSGPIIAIALAFANAIAYIDALVERGYDAAAVAGRMMFFLNERSDLFVGAASFRTARRLWAKILAERFAVDPVEPMVLMGYAHGLETSKEPLVNVPRCAVSVVAAVLGGVDYLCAASYDEALRVPSPDAAALALRTIQVVGHEHGVASSLDALSGSHKFEEIGEWIASAVERELEEIEGRGGAVACVENGYVAGRLDQRRGVRQHQLDRDERTFVGENRYVAPRWHALFAGASKANPDVGAFERELIERVRTHKARHRGRALDGALDVVRQAAAGDGNLVPPTIDALHEGATIEQIVGATRHGFERVS